VPDLDERHRLLLRYCRAQAADLRPHALAVDRDPATMATLLDLPAVRLSARMQIPASYNPAPLVLGSERFYLTSALERTVFCEAVAWADLGIMLALPGASMCGVLVDAIGDDQQKEWFYGRLLDRPTWTFFALTEPSGGSDAGAMRTRLREAPGRDEPVLDGAKRYVSNAVRASLGAVFFRGRPGPLGVGAALVETSAPGFSVTAIDTMAVRGAQLGAITLDSVPVAPDRILGRHLSPVRRGTLGWMRTFNLLRPGVASMAVGLAQAAHDYVVASRRTLHRHERARLDQLSQRIESVRQLTRQAAAAVDHDPSNGHLGSAAKRSASILADQAARQALTYFGPGARLEHPLLDKLARDASALEFMEGTSNIQRLNLAGALTKGQAGARLSGPSALDQHAGR
jgi:acyl-CoA dehydrogenase